MLARILAISLITAAPAFVLAASVEETEIARNLSRDATEFLDRLLGPGRAKILVTVEGERAEIHTETELITPILEDNEPKEYMPGYVKPENKAPVDYYQKDRERAHRRKSFDIKRIRIAAVLDETLNDDQVKVVQRILPELLRMDGDRGDDMTILRAPLLPAWKRAWLSPEGMRTLMIISGLTLVGLLVSLVAAVTLIRIVRAFAGEILVRQRGSGATGQPALPTDAEAFPELGADGMPGIGGAQKDIPLLGQRFDFILDKNPAEVADLLAREPAEDIALLFAYLADSQPDAASRVFTRLPQGLQMQASSALIKLDMADPERLAMLENRLKTNIEFGLRGSDRLGTILSRLGSEERDALLEDINTRDPRAAEDVEAALFPFEGIGDFKPEDLRRLIVSVAFEDWGAALRGADQNLIDTVLKELPVGTRALVRDRVNVPQPKDKVLTARSKVLNQAYALADKGQISLGRQGSGADMI
jgi:hypothetical protein